jgi:toxin YoeB
MALLKDIQRNPNEAGLGKSERLKGNIAGYSSRRINDHDRLVYRLVGDEIVILQARGHY